MGPLAGGAHRVTGRGHLARRRLGPENPERARRAGLAVKQHVIIAAQQPPKPRRQIPRGIVHRRPLDRVETQNLEFLPRRQFLDLPTQRGRPGPNRRGHAKQRAEENETGRD